MNKIEFGDCRETMEWWSITGVKAQMCVTSPPYFGLRDYGVEGQIGLEETPDQYITAMVDVFRCVRDVLTDDGTLWLNIGDSYATGTTASRQKGDALLGNSTSDARTLPRIGNPPGCKTKDLIGIPWMLAFALRADGWYLRQDIIWHKPNPMPESVRDRCTKAHEYIFLFSKSPRYHFDSDAMKEKAVGLPAGNKVRIPAGARGMPNSDPTNPNDGVSSGVPWAGGETRNRRSVWSVPTRPYKGAHFATFPPALIEPCILAGSRVGDVVLDPFMGSGTTAAVALEHGRNYLGCELNPEYESLQRERISKVNTL